MRRPGACGAGSRAGACGDLQQLTGGGLGSLQGQAIHERERVRAQGVRGHQVARHLQRRQHL